MPTPADRLFVKEHLQDDLSELALTLHGRPALDASWILRQTAGYQAARRKLPEWYGCDDILFPPSLSMEQCSSEQTARYKAEVVGETLPAASRRCGADLTGGFGVDAWALSPLFDAYRYVERNEDLSRVAAHNFQVLGRGGLSVACADAVDTLRTMDKVDFLFLDPARRDSRGGKVFTLSACEPDVTALWPLLREKCRFLLLKLSPMLDLSAALNEVPEVCRVDVVAVDNDCKELLLSADFTGSASDGRLTVHTVNFTAQGRQDFSFVREAEKQAVSLLAQTPSAYLYEPNAAVMKAGAFKSVGRAFGLMKMHEHTHLYTSDVLAEAFPGRVLQVQQWLKPSSREARAVLTALGRANVCTRNYPETVDTLRRRFRLKEGGDRYLYGLTAASGERWLALCRRVV